MSEDEAVETPVDEAVSEAVKPVKRPYEKPTVTPLGTLINLTKGDNNNTAPDGGAST